MINSLKILAFFVFGIVFGVLEVFPEKMPLDDVVLYLLYFLVFFAGISIGLGESVLGLIKKMKLYELLFPLGMVLASFLGGFLSSFFFDDIQWNEGMAIASGFGYYSLSAVIITDLRSEYLGTIALLSNILREMTTFLFAFILAKRFTPMSVIATAGATSMDTTMPIIMQTAGKQYVLLSIYHGIVLSSLVPILLPILLEMA